MKVYYRDFDSFDDFADFLLTHNGDESIKYYVGSPAERLYVLGKLEERFGCKYDEYGSYWFDYEGKEYDGKINIDEGKHAEIRVPTGNDIIDEFNDKDGSVWYLAMSDIPGIYITWSKYDNEVVTDPVYISPYLSSLSVISDIDDLKKALKKSALIS